MKKNKGFTLIEMLIAMFILGSCLLAMGTQIGVVMKTTVNNKLMSTATQLLQDKGEALKNTPYNQISNGNDSLTKMQKTFNRSWTVATNGNMKSVSIAVTWNDKSLTANTLVSEF